MTEQEQPKNDFMHKLALQIVERRNLVFLIVILGTIFTIFSRSWVKVESDLTTYLPKTSETRMGLDIMEKEFTTYGSADVMVANITPDEADQLNDELAGLRGIQMIEYDDTTAHYNNVSALYSITFDYPEDDERCLEALDRARESLTGWDVFVSTELGNTKGDIIDAEVNVIMVYVAIIIVVVLIFTSQTYAEVPVLLLTFVVGMILNMGTNFLLGTISFVSNSVTNILQLALSLDYAIIFCNHFKEEHETLPLKEAVIESLAKSIPEISSSSLTTIGGLVAMLFMQFKIGPDMAICLIKAILFSMLSVFVVMPGLLMLFGPYMSKTKHRNFVPKISFVGRYAYKTRKIVPIVFAVVLVFAYHFQTQCPYAYGYGPIKTPVLNETQIADNMIDENFTKSNLVALVVPKNDDYRVEAAMIKELESHDEVDHTRGLSNIEAMDGYTLTDSLNPRELSELVGMDYEVAQLLYSAYAIENDQYGEFVQGLDKYDVPLFDMLMFLKGQLDSHNISLDDMDEASLNDIFSQLDMAQKQLKSDRYSRMVVYLNLPEESDETFAFLDEMRSIVGKYYDSDYYVEAGDKISRGNNTKVQANKVGYAANSFYVYQQVYDENGKPIENMFVDRNGNGTIDSGDKYIYKKPAGDVLMGLTSKMQYKNFDFSFFLRGMFDYDVLNEGAIYFGTTVNIDQSGTNVYKDALKNKVTEQPLFSSYYLEKGNFLKIDNVTLGYTFNFKNNKYVRNLRIYGNVTNLATITGYSGLTPDVNVTGLQAGIEKRGSYPTTRTFTFGVNFGF